MSQRPLAIVSGLIIGDYLLWNWSLNHGHDVLALVSGLTLPPLTIACVWLLAVAVARLLARTSRRSSARARTDADTSRTHPAMSRSSSARRRHRPRRGEGVAASGGATQPTSSSSTSQSQPPATASAAAADPSRKLAA